MYIVEVDGMISNTTPKKTKRTPRGVLLPEIGGPVIYSILNPNLYLIVSIKLVLIKFNLRINTQ